MFSILKVVLVIVLGVTMTPNTMSMDIGINNWDHLNQKQMRQLHDNNIKSYRAPIYYEDWKVNNSYYDYLFLQAKNEKLNLYPILAIRSKKPSQKDFNKFCSYYSSRYKYIKYWEILNETNTKTFWHEKVSAKNYALYSNSCRRSIKRSSPQAKTLAAGIAWLDNGYNYLKQLEKYSQNDIISLHLYGTPYYNNQQLIKAKKATKRPIWVTEFGSSKNQSQYILSNIKNFERRKISKAFWFSYEDISGIPQEWGSGYTGLIDVNGNKKASWYTLTRLVN